MRRPRFVTIVVHRDGALESRQFQIPLWLLRVLSIAGIALFVTIVLAAVLYAPIVRVAAQVPSMRREISRLRAENAQVTELASTLRDMEDRYEQVRQMMGADVVPEGPRPLEAVPVVRPVAAVTPEAASAYPEGPSDPDNWPLDERGFVTRGPVPGGMQAEGHAGLDIAVPSGTPIRAAGGGIVVAAGDDSELGLFVEIQHPHDYESIYGHASRLLVVPGDSVSAGQVIALSGSTGRSTAPHLHFEIRHAGQSVDPRTMKNEGQ